ncbi:MAG: CHAT domain-containing protein [Archangium sp.]
MMQDVIVLLPGFLGSTLSKNGKPVWSLSAGSVFRALVSLGDTIKDLQLASDDDEVVASGLLQDTHLIPGLWKVDGYTRVSRTLVSRFGLQAGHNFFEFAYDWRRDIRVASRQLAQHSPGWLKAWKQRSGARDAKLVLIGHSMGGLVARHFLEVLDGWKHTRALITFGTPHLGSLNALDVLANGFKKGLGPLNLLDLTSMVRSLPSMYQVLPTFKCVRLPDGSDHVPAEIAVPGLDGARAAAGLAFHTEIREAAKRNIAEDPGEGATFQIHSIVGTNQPTKLGAKLTATGVECLYTLVDGQDVGGDGTVPRVSAIAPHKLHDARVTYVSKMHASMQNADEVLVHLEGVLTGQQIDLGQFRDGPPVEVALKVEDVYSDDEPIHIRATSSSATELVALVANTESGELRKLQLQVGPDGSHAATINNLAPGVYRITVRGNSRSVIPVTDVFAVFARAPDLSLGVPPAIEGDLSWSLDFDVVPASMPIHDLSKHLEAKKRAFVVLDRGGDLLYAFSKSEIHEATAGAALGAAAHDALTLREDKRSQQATAGTRPTRGVLPGTDAPSKMRVIVVGPAGQPRMIGEARSPRPDLNTGKRPSNGLRSGDTPRGDQHKTPTVAAEVATCTRHPSIQPKEPVRSGQPLRIDVDLLLQPASNGTETVPLLIATPAPDWKSLKVNVKLRCTALTFTGPMEREVVVNREANSNPATFETQVPTEAKAGETFEVYASFYVGGRYSGAAQRTLHVEGAVSGVAPTMPEARTEGNLVVDTRVPPPLLTVEIHRMDRMNPCLLYWIWDAPRGVPGMPARPTGKVDLGESPAQYFAGLSESCSELSAGSHQAFLEGIGLEIWEKAPAEFRQAYTALRQARGKDFSIQFVSDDPHIPWELMIPQVPDGRMLAIDHPVGRWILDHKESMSGWLPKGEIATVAPSYVNHPSGLPDLSEATKESKDLVTAYNAIPIAGRHQDVLKLLTIGLGFPVSIFHFAGHGRYTGKPPNPAELILEDINLKTPEVRRTATALGRDFHPLVILNACQVGAAGDALGGMGGWSEAFVKSGFSAIVAPLWKVHDHHARDVVTRLVAALRKSTPIGEALRAIREHDLTTSQTHLAYVLIGDVNAVQR